MLAVIAIKLKQSAGPTEGYPYIKKQVLFSPAERSFLGVLNQAIGEEYLVFGKVRVADIVEPQRSLDKSKRQRAFNRISAKHFDFVLCAKGDLAVVCAIELNDHSHQQSKRQDRDAFLVGLCQAISLPLIQMPAQRTYSVPEIRTKVLSTLEGHPLKPLLDSAPVETVASLVSPLTGDVPKDPQVVPETETPTCPKCAAPMVRRQAKKAGGNTGQEFWGCSTYPKCRGVIQGNV
jgi:hypothetical protein